MNTLALRLKLEEKASFVELLHQAQRVTLEGYGHQDIGFEQLVSELQVERTLSHSPLFQVMFTLENEQSGFKAESKRLGEMEMSALDVESVIAKFDLSLGMQESEGGLIGSIEYNSDLFDRSRIERMVGHFQVLLQTIVQNPQQALWQLPLLPKAEREQLLVEWNRTERDYPQEKCIHQMFEEQVARTPHAVAVVMATDKTNIAGEISFSYAELNARANQLAHYLQRLGVVPGTLVGICVERSLEMIVGLLGILKAGGAYVPIDPAYPADRLAFLLQDSATPVLLTQAHLLEQLPSTSTRLLCLDRDWAEMAQESGENPQVAVQSSDLAYVIYTSGSTGQPKGTMNIHRGICNLLHYLQESYQLTPEDSTLQTTVFSFDVATSELFWPLLNGARLVLTRPDGQRDSSYLVSMLQRYEITTLHLVPSLLQVLLEEPTISRCTGLKRAIVAGEALPVALQDRFLSRLPHAELHNLYGPTETSIYVTAWHCQTQPGQLSVPIGRPVANTQMYVLDRHLQPMPMGVPGELHIGGIQVGRGYYQQPRLTEEKFIPDPFVALRSGASGVFHQDARLYKTGDLARWLPNGTLEYLGRIDHQVKIRGFRIELGEIETVLSQHPALQEAVVLAREEQPGDKRLVAFVVQGSQDTSLHKDPVDSTTLRTYLQTKLPCGTVAERLRRCLCSNRCAGSRL